MTPVGFEPTIYGLEGRRVIQPTLRGQFTYICKPAFFISVTRNNTYSESVRENYCEDNAG